ncbi:MAG: LysM peptidoglycan-binding domain-containing protein [Wenzhouxiangella sp.]
MLLLTLLAAALLALSGCASGPGQRDEPVGQLPPADWHTHPRRARENDVWGQLSRQFAMPVPTTREGRARVQRYVDFYLRHPNVINVSLNRAEPWVEHLLAELDRRNMPGELFFVPLIESGFAPNAVSPSGAVGIWQFMPATGAHFGLRQNASFDGRRDVFASTEAALDYLEILHRRFGDWSLTLAAFNYGQGNVARAIEANQRAGRRTDYWSLQLSSDAMSYVPRILALRHIMETRRLPLPRHNPANTVVGVPVDVALDLQRVAALSQVSLEQLRTLNPATRTTVLPPMPAGTRLALPSSALPNLANNATNRRQRQREPIEAARAALVAAAAEAGQPGSAPAMAAANAAGVHVVQVGESLWGIAAQHGVDLGELGEVNGLARGAVLSPGQQLRLPASRNADTAGTVHRIQRGDTLFSIARLYGISVDALRQANHIPGDLLRVGETLVIPRLR